MPLFTFLLRLFCYLILLPAGLLVLIPLPSYDSKVALQIPARFASSPEDQRRIDPGLDVRMDIASLLEPVLHAPDPIMSSSSSVPSQPHHYAPMPLPLPPPLQQAQRMGSISSTTSSVHSPVQHNNNNNNNSTTREDSSASSSQTGTSPRHRGNQTKAACIPCRKRKSKVCYRLVSFLSPSLSPSLSLPTSKISKLIYLCNIVRRQAPLLQILY